MKNQKLLRNITKVAAVLTIFIAVTTFKAEPAEDGNGPFVEQMVQKA